ncbi:MAG: hypothetical protein V1821_02055 [bacterium]
MTTGKFDENPSAKLAGIAEPLELGRITILDTENQPMFLARTQGILKAQKPLAILHTFVSLPLLTGMKIVTRTIGIPFMVAVLAIGRLPWFVLALAAVVSGLLVGAEVDVIWGAGKALIAERHAHVELFGFVVIVSTLFVATSIFINKSPLDFIARIFQDTRGFFSEIFSLRDDQSDVSVFRDTFLIRYYELRERHRIHPEMWSIVSDLVTYAECFQAYAALFPQEIKGLQELLKSGAVAEHGTPGKPGATEIEAGLWQTLQGQAEALQKTVHQVNLATVEGNSRIRSGHELIAQLKAAERALEDLCKLLQTPPTVANELLKKK